MDLEAIHAIAPDAKKVLVNARPTVEGGGAYEKIAAMMEDAATAVSRGGVELLDRMGLRQAHHRRRSGPGPRGAGSRTRKGTTAFDASGDLAGLECKGGEDWSTPPGPDEVGLDAVASVPEMTDVGGTSLSTDADGSWLAEQAWYDVPLLQGTGGGVSSLFDRPRWQEHLDVGKGDGKRLTPDISAVADPDTGVKIVFASRSIVGGGTSLAAPLWAGHGGGDQPVPRRDNGGRPLGDLNPLLYEVAQGAGFPPSVQSRGARMPWTGQCRL